MAAQPVERIDPREALLDAAERLLVQVGYGAISARRLAKEAGVNLGLVHYHFGSMENVFVEALERYTGRLVGRQKALYAAEAPFIQKWRTAMDYLLTEDISSGYEKIWLELQAMAWNRPDLKKRLARVNARWRAVLTKAFDQAMREYGLDQEAFPLDAFVSLVMTFNLGIMLERHTGVFAGHRELLGWIDRWLEGLEHGKKPSRGRGGT
ncbi:MAG: TetR/AcrR family transcriptional regulator [Actinomycetota bacterium]